MGAELTTIKELTDEDAAFIQEMMDKLAAAKKEIGRAFIGQDALIDGVVASLISGGNELLTGVPGVAKTVLAESLGQVFGLEQKRIQCTPDLTPMDIIGSEVLETDEKGNRTFRFIPGPIFTQVLLVDEINRASPRTQAALLQAMQEKKVTVGGRTYKLPEPFFVIATQNPIDQEGTNPLPEAQKDRFLTERYVTYPGRDAERQIMTATTGTHHTLADLRDKTKKLEAPINLVVKPSELAKIMEADDVIRVQHLVRMLPLGTKPCEKILDVVRNARPSFNTELQNTNLSAVFNFVAENVEYGPGTRALQAFSLLSRAKALLRCDLTKLSPTEQDIIELAPDIIRHRMAATPTGRMEFGNNEMDANNKIIGKVLEYHSPG